MGRYIIKRLLLMIPVIIGVTLLIFLLQAFTPGDPAQLALGSDATEAELEQWREERGLNDPIIVQYVGCTPWRSWHFLQEPQEHYQNYHRALAHHFPGGIAQRFYFRSHRYCTWHPGSAEPKQLD